MISSLSQSSSSTPPNPWQQQLIEQQLGRPAIGMRGIAHATSEGVPVVLVMAPMIMPTSHRLQQGLNKNPKPTPFPTLYWLCSKDLHKAISQLEANGLVKSLEQRLQDDKPFLKQYLANHQSYVDARWQACSEDDKHQLERHGFTQLMHSYGIGGIRDWQKIRCLHMHYAHHLCGDNVIGQYLDEHFGLHDLVITK